MTVLRKPASQTTTARIFARSPAVVCALAIAVQTGCGVRITRLFPGPADDVETDGGIGGDAAADPDANAEPGIQIDGRWIPRARAIVLIHIGHSNMSGRAVNPPELKPHFHEPHPQLWSYRAQDTITATGPLLFRPAVEPLAEDTATQGRAGPGMALLRAALTHAPDAFIISIGSGQSGALYGLCDSYRKGGLFYDYTMRPARALRGKVTFAAVFTMFGANEFWGDDPAASGLSGCLRQLAADVRGELGEPDLPIMVGDFEMTAGGQYLPSLPGPAAVIGQLRLAVDTIDRSALIPTEGLPLEDDHHFSLVGHKLWAERALQILRDRAWAGWAGP
jgi:hypothetical protein